MRRLVDGRRVGGDRIDLMTDAARRAETLIAKPDGLSNGDRVQFHAWRPQRSVANRELVVERIEKTGRRHVRLEQGRKRWRSTAAQPRPGLWLRRRRATAARDRSDRGSWTSRQPTGRASSWSTGAWPMRPFRRSRRRADLHDDAVRSRAGRGDVGIGRRWNRT